MNWLEIGRDLGIFSIAAFFIERIIGNSFSQKLEKYKQELDFTIRSYQLTIDSDLERYKSELNLTLTRQTVLHEKRLKIIEDMYKLIVNLDSAMQNMTGITLVYDNEDGETKFQAKVDTAQTSFADYNNYYMLNKLYFDKTISSLLDNIRKEYFSANFDFFEPKRLKSFTGGKPSPESFKNALETSQNAIKRIQKDIPKTLEQLDEHFRKLLGVN